jgi:hypothetical protein
MLSNFNGSLTYSNSKIRKAIKENGPDFCFTDYKNLIDLLQDIYKEFNESGISQIIEMHDKNGKIKTFEYIMDELANLFNMIKYYYEPTFSKSKHDQIFKLPLKVIKGLDSMN